MLNHNFLHNNTKYAYFIYLKKKSVYENRSSVSFD